jgi:hypothetical protein
MVLRLRQTAHENRTNGTCRVVLHPDGVTSSMTCVLREWETFVFRLLALDLKSVKQILLTLSPRMSKRCKAYSRPIKKLAFPVRFTTASLPLTQVQLSAAEGHRHDNLEISAEIPGKMY